jgi:hypothetical protein
MATTAATHDRRRDRNGFRRKWIEPSSPRSLALWFGLGAPVFAWATQLVISELIFELGCARGVTPVGGRREILGLPLESWALIETAAFTALAVAGGLAALWSWRWLRGRRGMAIFRAKAMALGGIASAVYYLLFLAFGFLPMFWLHSCQTSL